MTKLILALVGVTMLGGLTACHTISGVGQDVSSVGRDISSGANAVKRDM